eukprot:TRINITY_DN14239_c0_g1_i1.p4 TRINITY_DN14239_c0_g1~~TRINITY_DN14239_c0_g1_i1.p4  ORF type:complete len:101 (-),score=13.99 TRINITY_DN14239_c0_g1_i1:639-941(-)
MCAPICPVDKRRLLQSSQGVYAMPPTIRRANIAAQVLETEIELEARHFGRQRRCLCLSPHGVDETDDSDDEFQLKALRAARALIARCKGRARKARELLSL